MRTGRGRRGMGGSGRKGAGLLLGLLALAPAAAAERTRQAALYPQDARREMGGADHARFPGAGILYCRRPDGVPQTAAAAWLVGAPDLVVLNAHNFRDRRLDVTRQVADCHFQIAGRNYAFVAGSLKLGTAPGATRLHITDDWALLRLAEPVLGAPAQPVPQVPDLPVGPASLPVTMVSPAGHENFRGGSSLEDCVIRQVDPPEEDAIRRVRHDCNNGYGGSGSGLFDASGRLIALQSASLSMNSRRAFDAEFHYGSALLFEGDLLAAIRAATEPESGARRTGP
ncbi:trypsin-like peptidase domain-containing protein [Methylobacterium segetis]|uniref:trypsin-like peptidase domain-containing protein n=1 Tax=Methylobacterium segetis TaxID=2488750 RepID=UPI001043BEE3|nr:trypsin-like peptidase domain-containing protein [Methylobacterium segetis]